MESLENELRAALRRREAPGRLADRVMARVRQEPVGIPARNPSGRWRRWPVIGAVAASMILGIIVQQNWFVKETDAEQAEQQLLMALGVAGEKIGKARDAVLRPGLGDSR